MDFLRRLLGKIPDALSSMPSVFIFIFLFVYLFILGVVGLFAKSFEPSANVQLVFGNYTNVLSALGAALAAGAGSHHTKKLKELSKRHDDLAASLEQIHQKLDELAKK